MGRLEISEAESLRSASSQNSKKEQDSWLFALLGIALLSAHKQSHFSSEPVESAEWDPEHQSCLLSPAPSASLGSEGQNSSAESFLASYSVLLQTQTSEEELHKN